MGRTWCLDCEQYVNAERKSHFIPFFAGWGAILIVEVMLFITAASNRASGAAPLFLIFLITLVFPIFLYPALSSGTERCPICNGTNFSETKITGKMKD